MATEFGSIPPSFLPIGTDYIFELIAQDYGRWCERLFLSVPYDFVIDETTHRTLARHGIELLRVDPADTIASAIGDALEQAMTQIDGATEFILVHGDSYVPSDEVEIAAPDFYATAEPTIFHDWGVVNHSADGSVSIRPSAMPAHHQRVIAGIFGLSDPHALLQILRDGTSEQWLVAISKYMTDKRGVQVPVNKWSDFSFSASYYASRRWVNATREFNNIATDGHYLVKSSSQKFKIKCENDWFTSIPHNLRVYTPLVYDFKENNGTASYKVEYLSIPSLANILLFGRLSGFAWRNVFKSIDTMMSDFSRSSSRTTVENMDLEKFHSSFFIKKTASRIAQFGDTVRFGLDSPVIINGQSYVSVNALTEIVVNAIPAPSAADVGVVHGDLCASNVMYDFAAQRVKVIDPRGYFEDGISAIYGDRRYEVAKLSHSFIGLYDFIVAGRFELNQGHIDVPRFHFEIYEPEQMRGICETFEEQTYSGFATRSNGVWEMMVSLFLSMLPLHSDSRPRQLALLCNAYRLMDQYRPDLVRV